MDLFFQYLNLEYIHGDLCFDTSLYITSSTEITGFNLFFFFIVVYLVMVNCNNKKRVLI